MKFVKKIKKRVVAIGKGLAYSTAGHHIARKVLEAPLQGKVRTALSARGLDDSVRRLASEHLPHGVYFAKLRIDEWQKHKGNPFRLFQDGQLIYGNQIEPPTGGFPLEYRNILVTSADPKAFSLDINTPFSLKIGRGAFTTPQQLAYDQKNSVQQHGDVFYSLRGNTRNPTKLIFSFPRFAQSTSRVSHTVNSLKALTDGELKDTLLVCFQDRYLTAGSYMMVDNAGRPLHDRVNEVIAGFSAKHHIADGNILFYGTSNGASIAIYYARGFPGAQLLLAAPQMDLTYYFSQPIFRDNLFRNMHLRALEQPQTLLSQYFSEGRKIDYFYSNNDELSNHSLIELARDIPNLTKYRVNGAHDDVARVALQAILGTMRRFLAPKTIQEFSCVQVRAFPKEETIQVQVRVDNEASAVKNADWFLEGHLGQTTFRQIMNEHQHPFIKYTADDQKLLGNLDPIDQMSHLTAISVTGELHRAPLDHVLATPATIQPAVDFDQAPY